MENNFNFPFEVARCLYRPQRFCLMAENDVVASKTIVLIR